MTDKCIICGEFQAELCPNCADEPAKELRKQLEVLRSGVRSIWHGIVDADMDRISAAAALKALFR